MGITLLKTLSILCLLITTLCSPLDLITGREKMIPDMSIPKKMGHCIEISLNIVIPNIEADKASSG